MASAAFESQAADLPDSEENHNGVTSSASTASTPPNHDHTDGPGPRVVDALVDLDHKDQQHRFPPSAHQWRTRRRAYSLTDADRERMAEVRAAQWQQAYMEENKHLALLPAFNRLSTIAMMVEAKEGTGRHRKRPKWSSKTEYMLSCISFAVGLGNLWRFPYLCYENGGGAFLVPYFVALLLLGMPMFLLELAMGQKLQMGHVRVWRSVHSKLSGLGVASAILSGICALYYNIIITWAIYFFIHSFSPVLPWTEGGVDAADSAKKFWLEEALRQAPDMNGGGGWGISPLMIACLTIAWLMVYFCIFRGISSTGKVVYFTALFPYVVLAILFVRGVTLPGAVEGIKYYLKPDLTRLANFRVWSIAGSQIFFSIGISWGSLINFASFNSQKNNIFMDTLIVCIVNCGTSLFAGFVVFSVLGYMAFKTGLPIDEVARAGSGLAFVVYPAGLGTMNHAFVFSILFFLMLICLVRI
ncbi:unnamed protein product [Vitrella brassicaformis CCMP3155]|uniref:Transporter n=1 Tax=Vitrella brassicaformis (strain CCMP3155) TaxID=1169540 RepID=A0A0G4GKT9_VITBC|nr:unnamed protein product [Vitrella brassicaformis CCMP3155]|eukprot:CEM30635.1 unnamed protein product [Vitrella brassicaformis CCMP3155]